MILFHVPVFVFKRLVEHPNSIHCCSCTTEENICQIFIAECQSYISQGVKSETLTLIYMTLDYIKDTCLYGFTKKLTFPGIY